MKRFITVVSLGLGLVATSGGVSAQVKDVPFIVGNVDGSCVTAPSLGHPGANAGDWTITCGDINPGSGTTVIGPPSVETVAIPVDLVPAPVDEPAAETTVDAVETDTAVVTETDLDNVDTDGDGVADSDEINVYGTDPYTWDTDGDGPSDGEELFVTGTDPLVWDTDGDGVSDGEEVAAGTDPLHPASVPGTEGDTIAT